MISKHVIKYIQSTVDDMVAESVRTHTEPLIKQIEDNHHTIKCIGFCVDMIPLKVLFIHDDL